MFLLSGEAKSGRLRGTVDIEETASLTLTNPARKNTSIGLPTMLTITERYFDGKH